MARRFRKEFVKLFIKTHISNTELRVEKVINTDKIYNNTWRVCDFQPLLIWKKM